MNYNGPFYLHVLIPLPIQLSFFGMPVVTLEGGHWLENSAAVSDPELFRHSLIGSHGHCSHSHMSTNICIYNTWIKISILWIQTNTHTHTVCRMSCSAMQLCGSLSLQLHSRHLLDHIRKHREWVNKYILPKTHLPLHSRIQQKRISRKKSFLLDTLLWSSCNLRFVEDVVVLDILKLPQNNGDCLADPVKLSVHVNWLWSAVLKEMTAAKTILNGWTAV